MEKLKVIMTKGLPSSGKSTWARERIDKNPEKYKRVNKDDLRLMIDNGKWSGKNESLVIKIRDKIIIEALKAKKSVIVDDTNLDPKHEKHIRDLVNSYNEYAFEVKEFDIPLDEAIKRDSMREPEKKVGAKVIHDMYDKYIAPFKKIQKLIQDESLPHCVICDVDGTIAERTDRGPFEWNKVSSDLPKKEIINIIHRFYIGPQEKSIVFFSGRKECCKETTIQWINKNVFDNAPKPIYNIFMRRDSDDRKDSIVKNELFDEHIRGKMFVEFVLDDRNQVVEMWRSLGLTCLQVQDGSF